MNCCFHTLILAPAQANVLQIEIDQSLLKGAEHLFSLMGPVPEIIGFPGNVNVGNEVQVIGVQFGIFSQKRIHPALVVLLGIPRVSRRSVSQIKTRLASIASSFLRRICPFAIGSSSEYRR